MNTDFWLGYCEHATPDRLNEFEENIGKGHYTIFADMVWRRERRNMQGFPWCATFVYAVLNRPDILGKAHPGVVVLWRRMKRKGLLRGRDYKPEPYDLCFCSNDGTGTRDHVGIVESADEMTVTCIDGNSHDDKGRFAWQDGGVVARNIRERDNPMIIGYAATGHLIGGT